MEKSISLHYQDSRSDKVYNVFLQKDGEGFVVNFSYGRRGSALATGTKTQASVSVDKAEKIFDKLVAEKMAKQYHVINSNGGGGVMSVSAKESSGVACQLSNAIEESDVEHYLSDDNYLMQVKYDGRRQLLEKKGPQLKGINRKGLYVGFPTDLSSLECGGGDALLDGELLDDGIVVFDALELNGKDLRGLSCDVRFRLLEKAIVISPAIRIAETVYSTTEKRALFERIKNEGGEGVIFKLVNSPYTAGRPSSGGDHLKFKFYKTASFVVSQINDKRSVGLSLTNEQGTDVSAGNVTIPPNHQIPAVGDVVEVRYLYAYRNSGIIFQPVYLGKRGDIETAECLTSQLAYKNEQEAA